MTRVTVRAVERSGAGTVEKSAVLIFQQSGGFVKSEFFRELPAIAEVRRRRELHSPVRGGRASHVVGRALTCWSGR